MKKEILAILMAVAMLLSLFGCGNSATEVCKTIAQRFIDEGNIESAKKVLEGGIAETKSKDLQAMLDGFSSADLSDYDGIWAEENFSYENSGLIMHVSTDNGATVLNFEYVGETIGFTDRQLDHNILKNEVEGSTITIKKEMDIYGNFIDMTILFSEDIVICEITNIEEVADVSPLFKEGTYTLELNEDVYSALSDMSWSDAIGIKTDGLTKEPYYDISKASGILEQLGMTEEEFRTSCQPLLNYDRSDYRYRTTQELLDFPSQYIGQHFTFYDSFYEDKLAPMHVSSKGISNDGYTTYTDYTGGVRGVDIIVLDYRDDIYSPTISRTDNIYPYMIFQGLRTSNNGSDYLCFQLISVDKE